MRLLRGLCCSRRRCPRQPLPLSLPPPLAASAAPGLLRRERTMSSASPPPDLQHEAPKEKDYRVPGLRSVRTTTLFRAVNPELFIKPNKPVMAFGLLTITLCVAYIGYLHAQQENKKDIYEAIDSEGNRETRRKISKWD
ncbi:small integral membrane protein 8 [Paroedura picta]|uniref:small integral membrane protein 8 n=1 Tax=Paroedura picta TaxID=143630 RepID=UPI0010155B40